MNNAITPLEVLPFLHGCCGISTVDGHPAFSRFTKEEIAYYSARSDGDFVRCHAPAGIWLECITDASVISFSYRLYKEKGLYLARSGFEIWEDHILAAVYAIDPNCTDTVTISYTRQKEPSSRIRIYFPNGCVVLMDNFCLGNAIPVEKNPQNILFYGDSITESAYIPTPSLSWTTLLAGWLNAEPINRGIGSMIFEAPSLPSVPDCNPDLLFIEYGCNDIGKTADNESALRLAEAWLEKICQLYPTVSKYCILPDFVPREGTPENYFPRLPHYCTSLTALCEKRGITPISGSVMIPAALSLFCEDHVHFNEAGSALFAGNLAQKLRPTISPV